eukprot:5980438-Amphidinium_carterae.1
MTELLLDEQNVVLDNADKPETVQGPGQTDRCWLLSADSTSLNSSCPRQQSHKECAAEHRDISKVGDGLHRLHEHILISEKSYHKQQRVKAFEAIVPGLDAKLMLDSEAW